MSLTDVFIQSLERLDEQLEVSKIASNLQELFENLEEKGYLRSELKGKRGEEGRKKYTETIWNIRKVNHAFNILFDMFIDRKKPHSKQILKNIQEVSKPIGLTEEDLVYFLCSEMIFVFLQNIEEFRTAFLIIMKLDKDSNLNKQTTLGRLLRRLQELKIKKIGTLINIIDYELRNGLSHGLWWLEKRDSGLDIRYSTDITFQCIKRISLVDLFFKTREQSLITNCFLNIIADGFQ